MRRSRHSQAFAVAVFLAAFLALAAAPRALALDRNADCIGCHETSQQFSVGAVDRDTACRGCHTPGLLGTHPYHQAGSNCAAFCHPSWGGSLPAATPAYLTSAGAFASPASKDTSAAILHQIHSSPRWPAGVGTPDSSCASCHQVAACTACHESGVSGPHQAHSSSSNSEWVGTVCFGIIGEDQSVRSATLQSNYCATSECHDLTGVATTAPILKEGFSHAAYPEHGYPELNTVTTTGVWNTMRDTIFTAGQQSVSNDPGATLSLPFTGERIEFIGDLDPYRGKAEILIDGVYQTTIDFYSPTTKRQQKLWTSPVLDPGSHTVTIEVLGTRNASSRGSWVTVDCFKAYEIADRAVAPGCTDSCHGVNGVGHEETGSHAVHLSATDPRGPLGLACGDCHTPGDYPYFASGTDADSSGRIELDETDVCDVCHSPNGSYDGVDSSPVSPTGVMSVGAKDNWATRVYENGQSLQAGKERWCVGCHDAFRNVPGYESSLINGVYAPMIAGAEDAASIYGTGYGFYATGHGVGTDTVLPSNGSQPGPGLDCDDCHDNSLPHIDGEHRTYSSSADNYRVGYRLDLVGGQEPMQIPRGTTIAAAEFRLCLQCHPQGPYTDSANTQTNFRRSFNLHNYHLTTSSWWETMWDSDWDGGGGDSPASCPTCHNVHGSERLAMLNDGTLVSYMHDWRPGLEMWYANSAYSQWNDADALPPNPIDVPMAGSNSWVWRGESANNVCGPSCHSGTNTTFSWRTLWQYYGIAPTLDWAGTTGYETDGANPDAASADQSWDFQISYADGNNDAPIFVNLLLDLNDDGDFADAGETIAMEKNNPADSVYFDGMVYSARVVPAKVGDNELMYRFECTDGITGSSTTPTRTVQVTNAIPVLRFTGDPGYEDDYVSPNSGNSGVTDYEFRITYSDADGEEPDGGILLQLNINDANGFNDPGEQIIMTDMGDPDVVAGKRYTATSKLIRNFDGFHMAFFTASDGIDPAPPRGGYATVLPNANVAPSLAWTGEPDYVADGVSPENQAAPKPFYFRINYTDTNADAPGVAQVWIDLDDDAVYEPGEKFPMDDPVADVPAALMDADYSNGETFAEKIDVPYGGDGTLTYRFYFEDVNGAQATGVHGTDKTLTVFDPINVPGDYASIQEAVNASNPGDTVLVADGTYAGFILDGHDIFVESENGPLATSIALNSAIQFRNTASDPSDSTISGFHISGINGYVIVDESNATIDDCIFDGTRYGVSIYNSAGQVTDIANCIFRSGTQRALYTTNANQITNVSDSLFENNTNGSSQRGPVLSGTGGAFTFDRCDFEGNVSQSHGGVFYMSTAEFDLTVRDSAFTDNHALGYGGVAYMSGVPTSASASFERSTFTGNQASEGGVFWFAGGYYDFDNCSFTGNYATNYGGALYPRYATSATITNCTIAGNSADQGGGIYTLTNTTSFVHVFNSIVWGNESRSHANNEIVYNDGARVEMRYTNIAQGVGSFFNQAGNSSLIPQFVSPVSATVAPTLSGDYHLLSISPLEGKASATYAPADDIDGGVRPQGTGDDMGSDEIATP